MADTNPFLDATPDPLPLVAAAPAPIPTPTVDTAPVLTPGAPAGQKVGTLPPPQLQPVYTQAAQQYNVPINILMALSNQESDYNDKAIGPATPYGNAKGINQYLDSTASKKGFNPFDAKASILNSAQDIRARLDAGYSMEDAVKEHFAGPDRAKWGPKTAAYGQEVLGRAGQIGDLLGASAPAAADPTEGGRYTPLDQDAVNNQFSPSMPRDAYAETFKKINPNAPQSVLDAAMADYDKNAAKKQAVAANKVTDQFAAMASPDATFENNLNTILQGNAKGIVPKLPGVMKTGPVPSFDEDNANRESKLSAASSLISRSTAAGVVDASGVMAKLLDTINPFTTSAADAAVLYKNDPDGLKRVQQQSTAMILSRFVDAANNTSDTLMANVSDRAKRDYGSLEYATTDTSKAAYLSPVKVISDAMRSLPSSAVMAASIIITRGAAATAENAALAAGMDAVTARQAAVQAGAKAMALSSASGEGAVGYAQQANQSTFDASKISYADLQKSPKYQMLVKSGFTPSAARAKIVADTGEQAGQLAGIVDAAVNMVGGHFLGKILTEGGSFIPRMMKGAADESLTEFVQSAGEQIGQNMATKTNTNPNQSLTEGAGEAALAGAAVGGLMGGVGAALGGGHAHVETAPAAVPGAAPVAPAAPVAATPILDAAAVAAPAPVKPLQAAVVNAANKGPTVTGDDGTKYHLEVGPDGMVIHEAEPDGPMTSAVKDAAVTHAASGEELKSVAEESNAFPLKELPAPTKALAPVITPATAEKVTKSEVTDTDGVVHDRASLNPAPELRPMDQWSDKELRDRLKYVAGQAKITGSNKSIVDERRRVEKEINARADAQEKADAIPATAAAPGPEKPTAAVQPPVKPAAIPAADEPSSEKSVLAVRTEQPDALTNPHEGKWFGSKEKAEAYLDKKSIRDTFEAVPTGRARFEIKPVQAPSEQTPTHQVGDKVKITSGIYSGNTGTIEKVKPSGYFTVRGDNAMKTAYNVAPTEIEQNANKKTDLPAVQPAAPTTGETNEPSNQKTSKSTDESTLESTGQNADEKGLLKEKSPITVRKAGEGAVAITLDPSVVRNAPPANKSGKGSSFDEKIEETVNPSTVLEKPPVLDEPALSSIRDGLRKISKPKEFDGSVRIMYGDRIQHVPLDDAVTAARKAVDAGVSPVPYQIASNTGIQIGETDRVIAELNKAGTTTPPANDQFANNKVFTQSAFDAARARMKSKLGTLNSGIDPELMTDGITIAGAYLESGVRTFSAYSKAMISDFGDSIKPYLLSFYEAARHFPGFDKDGMTPPAEAAIQHDLLTAPAPEKTSEPITSKNFEPAEQVAEPKTLGQTFEKAIADGNMPKDNRELRKIIEQFDGEKASDARMKEGQEVLESAIADHARSIVAAKGGTKAKYDDLVKLYNSQPNLNVRTSTSIENQAYSTPAPLAFVASQLAGIDKTTTVLEPTAGTGMLLIATDPKKVTANELNPTRAELLREQGYTVTQQDAITSQLAPEHSIDSVIANPPFGPIKRDGSNVKVKFDGYSLGQIDHLIAARALDAMKDDGKATIIIGANKIAGGLSNNDLIFMNWLYGNYNVTSHFEVDGDLYQRQGAGWPVRVITIDGRTKSARVSPMPGTIKRAKTWSDVYEQYQNGMAAQRGTVAPTENASVRDSFVEAEPESVPDTAGAKTDGADTKQPSGSKGRVADEPGTDPGHVGSGEQQSAGPVGAADGSERSDVAADGEDQLDDAGQNQTGGAAKPIGDSGAASLSLESEENQFQATYTPRSSRKDTGVLIPVNMQQPTQDALSKLEDQVGDIDKFAAKELGYKSVGELHDAFMGLQVDSVASAIQQIKAGKGVIIADQTGIGKGRQAAAIIRWAAKHGHTPVFVTVKPSLFTDMYGDLKDIGSTDINPFIMNVSESIKGDNDEKLFTNRAGTHKAELARMTKNSALPKGRNALFMTYSQINVPNAQRGAIEALAPNSVFILDESHNAGGDSSTGKFVQDMLALAKGVTYLSATYAKRPDNMPVYSKTDIGDAVADNATLMAAMESGGLPLQTVVSNNLVKAGQMFRRERSYDGVSIESRADTARQAEHEALSNETTLALRAIVDADGRFHDGYVKELQKQARESGGTIVDNAGNQAAESVSHSEFSSVVHNFVRQMLLGLKSQTAADEAIASLKRNEKPLIALENTMGSFLAEYADNNGIKPGQSLGNFDYRTVLSRALDRTRYVTRQMPNGDKVKEYVPLEKLDRTTRKVYDDAQSMIDGLKIDIPVSPLDWMRNEIQKAGYSVAEITGRNLSVDYTDPKNPKLSQLDPQEQRDKVRTTRLFNSGKLDSIILNVAGSTGISLHASERFLDQRQRHMIVAQAAQDINIFMQMLGRIHRTGQVALPKYTILSVDLPAEKRPTALLSKKMKSLNANTSSNTESATSVKSADMLNKYGDQVIGQYLADNPELSRDLGISDPMEGNGPMPDIARKATGRLALMPVAVQTEFYSEVEAQYNALMDYLNKTNQNDLEPRTFDFDAQELKSQTIFEGANKESPFGEDANYGEYSVKSQGKAMTPDEIKAEMTENLAGKKPSEQVADLVNTLKPDYQKLLARLEPGARQVNEERIAGEAIEFLKDHPIGSAFRIDINGDIYSAAVTNVRSIHKNTGNPFSMSKFHVTVAVNGPLRSVTIPASRFGAIQTAVLPRADLANQFQVQKESRETAKIVTGNLLAAYGELSQSRGTVISFSKQDGTTEQGILLPKTFDLKKEMKGDYNFRTSEDAYRFLTESTNKDITNYGVASRDGVIRVTPGANGSIMIQVPKSKAKGGKYFLDDRIRAVTGDFVSSGTVMRARVDAANAPKAIDAILQKQALYAPASMSAEAKSMTDAAKPPEPPDGPKGGGVKYSVGPGGNVDAEFGPVHEEFKDKPAEAIKALMSDKTGEAVGAVTRPDLGEISLVYGNDVFGLKHIAERRGANFLSRIPALLQNGTMYTKEGQTGRVFIGDGTNEAAIRLDWSGEAKTWLVSAYEKYPGGIGTPNVNPGTAGMPKSQRSTVVTQRSEDAGKGVTVDELNKTLRAGPLGSTIGALIDAGKIQLYDKAKKLPAALRRMASGIQAVTDKDGTIHMVANALTPERAQAVLLHEMFHSNVKGLIGTAQWSELQGRLGSLYRQSEQSSGAARDFWDKARTRVESARAQGGVTTKFEVEEFGAYAIEEYASAPTSVRKWVDDLIGHIKAWLQTRFGIQAGQITPAQLRSLAAAALRSANEETQSQNDADGPKHSIAPAEEEPEAAPITLTPPEQGPFRKLQAAVQDRFNRVKQVQDRISELTVVQDLGYADYYGAETNRPGRIAARLEDGKTKLLKPLMEGVAKAGYKPAQLEELLHAQHAEERNAKIADINPEFQDGGSGMTNAEAQAVLTKYSGKEFAGLHKLADMARNVSRETLDMKLAYGLITDTDYAALANAYENYVPLKGTGEFGPKIKRALGHDEREEHILDNIARDYDQAVVTGERNLARQSLGALVASNPDPELWSIGIPPKGRRVAGQVYTIMKGDEKVAQFDSMSQAAAYVEGNGSALEIVDSKGDRVTEFTKPLQDNEVLYFVKGQPVRLQIKDEQLARQIRPLNQDQMNFIIQRLQQMNRYFSKIYTGYNPAFILRNMARDAQTGTINAVGNHGVVMAAKAWAQYPMAIKTLAQWAATGKTPAGKAGDMLNEYRAQGGKVGASWMADLDEQGKNLQRYYDDAYGATGYLKEGKPTKAALIGARKAIGGLAHVVEIANQATENGLRLALYTALRNDGTRPSIAAQAAKSVTVDFDRKGTATGTLGALYLFLNPAIQGTANAAKTVFTGKHKYQALAAMSLLPLAGMFAAGSGYDDDKDRWLGYGWDTRTKNFIMKIGGKELRVPISQEYAPFYAMGVAIAEGMRGEGAMKSSARLLSSILDAYFPINNAYSVDSDNHGLDLLGAATPTALKPFEQAALNRNVWGSQIKPETDNTKTRPDDLKMFRGTKGSAFDQAAQLIEAGGEALGASKYENGISKVSPEILKHFWRTYTGGLGLFLTDTAGLANMAAEGGSDIETNDVPIVKDFVKNPTVQPIRSRFYDVARDVKAAAAEVQQAKKAGDGDAMDKFYSDPTNAQYASLNKLVSKASKAAAQIADEKVTVNADKTMTGPERRAAIKGLEQQEEDVYRDALNAFK